MAPTTDIELNALMIPEHLNALELFTGDAMEPLVAGIRELVEKHVPDTSTAKGRDEIRSLARKVSSTKVYLDEQGKNLVAEWKEKTRKVDIVRKEMRDELDEIRDYARAPLTLWEEEQEEKRQQEERERQLAQAWDEAHAEHALRERERIVREKEAEFARQEAARQAKLEAERLERERQEHEARIAKEAEEKAKRDAEAAIQQAKDRAERAEREKVEAEAKAKRDAEEAAERAKREQEAAVLRAQQQAKAEAERKEREQLAAEIAEKERLALLAADVEHRRQVNREAVASLEALGYTVEQAKKFVTYVATGQVTHITVNY